MILPFITVKTGKNKSSSFLNITPLIPKLLIHGICKDFIKKLWIKCNGALIL